MTSRPTFTRGGYAAALAFAFGFAFALPFATVGCDDSLEPAAAGTGGSTAQGSGGAGSGSGGAGGAGGGGGGAAAITDTDFVVARFNADGTPDTTFGTNGVFRKDIAPSSGNTREVVWGMDKDAQDRLLLFGFAKGEGTRTDTDRIVIR